MHYIPKWTEIAITASIIAVGFFIFALAARYLAIFPEERLQVERRMPAELSHVAAD